MVDLKHRGLGVLNERDLRVGNRRLTRFLREEVLGVPELSAATENIAPVSQERRIN